MNVCMKILYIYAFVDIWSWFLRSQSCWSDGIERVFEKEFFGLSSNLKLVGFHWKDFGFSPEYSGFYSKYSICQNHVMKEKKKGFIP